MIIACGPESNGTRLLARLLVSTGQPVMHRSLPYGKHWWTPDEFPEDTQYVVILRDIDKAVESVLRHGHIEEPVADRVSAAYNEQYSARDRLSRIDNAIEIRYEDLINDTERTIAFLEKRLGLPVTLEEQLMSTTV